VEANSTGGQSSLRAVAPSDDDDEKGHSIGGNGSCDASERTLTRLKREKLVPLMGIKFLTFRS
jgi:hypothetical protein